MGTAAQALGLALSLLLTFSSARTVNSGDTLEELQRRFDNEADGVNKAKMLGKLGDAQFLREREAVKAGDFSTAALIMEKYRDNVRAALDAVKKAHPDGERHPNGYKQLEMHIEGGLREVQDLLTAAPEPYQPPLEIVKADLLELDKETLHRLFPRRPGEKPLPPKPPADATPAVTPPSQEKQP
ncbi:MAG TPA: hypothetical protein VNK47_00335 [Candidatus Dormibacteraeota bacterium]|nr:hypothetical protein [Candidatus Dormibacteraeota bacterium]